MPSKDKETRKNLYKQLKEVGFNSYEANRIKDMRLGKIKSIIILKKESNKRFNDVVKGVDTNEPK